MSAKRYSFWKVMGVVAGLHIVLELIAIGVLSTMQLPSQSYSMEKFLGVKSLISQAVGVVFASVFFYYTLNYYYSLVVKKSATHKYILYTAGALSVYTTYNIVALKYLSVNGKELKLSSPLLFTLLASVVNAIFATGLSLLLAYLQNLRDEQKQRKILEQQKMELEVEKLQANYNFLKAQINPHFLHNTLNFFYAKSLPYSQELSDGILTLSEIMRYALSQDNVMYGRVPLADEIEHLRNVIKINQLRFSNKLNVHFEVNGVINNVMIIPFILITIVENAFKHGDLKNSESPINILLFVDDQNGIYFYCHNKKKTGPKELSTGIGLDNTKKRLDMIYGDQYTLNIKDEMDSYIVELNIRTL